MNALDKIKIVQNGLNTCGSFSHLCSTCPYNKRVEGCETELHNDALAVIDALKAELKKRTNKTVEVKPGFITLTAGNAYSSDGRIVAMVKNCRVAVRVNDILSVSDLAEVQGSEVRLNDARQTVFYVCETIEEILGKVADVTGGEE